MAKFLSLLVIVLFFTTGLWAETPLKLEMYPGKDSIFVSLEISTNKTEYQIGDSVNVIFIFRNISKSREIFIWDFFWSNSHLIVRDDKGNVLETQPRVFGTPPDPIPRSFHYLFRNYFVGRVRTISGKGVEEVVYPFEAERSYTIQCSLSVHQRNQLLKVYDEVPSVIKPCVKGDIEALNYFDNVWEGDVKSNIVKIRFVK